MAMMFAPDSALAGRVVASPNHGERRDVEQPDILLMHYTGMPDAQAALERLCEQGSDVSAHYVVFENGEIVQCVPEARRAWHAGEAFWAGATDINSRSIGIEIANPGDYWGYRDFPEPQVAAVIALARDIVARNRIRPERVLGHSDVAPARKQDPGEKFPWQRLGGAGGGLWVAPEPITDEQPAPADDADAILALQAQLARYGYGIAPTGAWDAQTRDVITAFQRHFRPARIDGIADASTCRTLSNLLTLLAGRQA
jgi:N-acetylmuramoyl-L-alanine amidase